MADEKLNTGPGEEKLPEAPAPVTADELQAPAPEQAAAPTPQQEGPAQPEPGDVVVSFNKINELMYGCVQAQPVWFSRNLPYERPCCVTGTSQPAGS